MVELILLALALALALVCLPWVLAALVAVAPTVVVLLIAYWLFTAACG